MAMKSEFYVEFAGNQTDYKLLVNLVKEKWIADGNKVKDIEKLDIYFKPEESACYYVINDDNKGSFYL